MKKQISRISVLQTSKVFAILYFLLSLLFAIPAGIYGILAKHDGAFAAFLIPFVYLAAGFVFWLILGALYNFVAKYFGGVEFDVNDVE